MPSICRLQLFRSLRAHQYISDQKKILKEQSAQTNARVVSVAYRLWLPFSINRVLNLTKIKKRIMLSICRLQLFHFLRAHQYSSDQKNILKNQSAQTTARVVSVAYHLWLPFCIHHWRISWSSYRKLIWVGFEPTTTEFRSDALTDWAIRPWAQLALRANFVQLLQFHRLFSVTFHFGCLLPSVAAFILVKVFCR